MEVRQDCVAESHGVEPRHCQAFERKGQAHLGLYTGRAGILLTAYLDQLSAEFASCRSIFQLVVSWRGLVRFSSLLYPVSVGQTCVVPDHPLGLGLGPTQALNPGTKRIGHRHIHASLG